MAYEFLGNCLKGNENGDPIWAFQPNETTFVTNDFWYYLGEEWNADEGESNRSTTTSEVRKAGSPRVGIKVDEFTDGQTFTIFDTLDDAFISFLLEMNLLDDATFMEFCNGGLNVRQIIPTKNSGVVIRTWKCCTIVNANDVQRMLSNDDKTLDFAINFNLEPEKVKIGFTLDLPSGITEVTGDFTYEVNDVTPTTIDFDIANVVDTDNLIESDTMKVTLVDITNYDILTFDEVDLTLVGGAGTGSFTDLVPGNKYAIHYNYLLAGTTDNYRAVYGTQFTL